MYKSINYNRTKRFFFFKIEAKIKVLKYILKNHKFMVFYSLLESIMCFFSKINSNYYLTKSSCIISGKYGSVYKQTKMSRTYIRIMGGNNLIYGIRKSSW